MKHLFIFVGALIYFAIGFVVLSGIYSFAGVMNPFPGLNDNVLVGVAAFFIVLFGVLGVAANYGFNPLHIPEQELWRIVLGWIGFIGILSFAYYLYSNGQFP